MICSRYFTAPCKYPDDELMRLYSKAARDPDMTFNTPDEFRSALVRKVAFTLNRRLDVDLLEGQQNYQHTFVPMDLACDTIKSSTQLLKDNDVIISIEPYRGPIYVIVVPVWLHQAAAVLGTVTLSLKSDHQENKPVTFVHEWRMEDKVLDVFLHCCFK